jgi:hypothetical protein
MVPSSLSGPVNGDVAFVVIIIAADVYLERRSHVGFAIKATYRPLQCLLNAARRLISVHLTKFISLGSFRGDHFLFC